MDLDLQVAYFWTSLFAVVALPAPPDSLSSLLLVQEFGRRCHGVNMARQSKAVASLGRGSPQTGRS
jgi:hypothetical protein